MAITLIEPSHAGAAPANRSADRAAPSADASSDREFTFDDLIDIINPLHHLPIVSTIYRALSGDEISVQARAVGGGLYGGPIGLLAAGATMAVEEATGLSADRTVASLFSDDAPEVEVAAAPTAVEPPAAEPPSAETATLSPEQAAAIAAANSPAAAPAAAQAAPQPASATTRFFPLPQDRAQLAARAGADQAAAPPAAAPRFTAEQSALLERFVANAQAGGGKAPLPPADGDQAEWFAARMQANLQKYAEAQAAVEGRAAQAQIQAQMQAQIQAQTQGQALR